MSWIHNFHVGLAYISVLGFVLRAVWAFAESDRLNAKPVRVLPHVVDTLLLVCGLMLVFGLGYSITSGWLAAKLVALLAYIGFGVMTLRATDVTWRILGFGGALVSVGYIFLVAFNRSAWPF